MPAHTHFSRFAALLLLCAPSLAIAEDTNCYETAMTQGAMQACAADALAASQQQLDTIYTDLQERTQGDAAALLNEAYQTWQAYRDAQCAFNGSASRGGSVHSMVVLQCRDALTQAYIPVLESQLHCEEGDVSCSP